MVYLIQNIDRENLDSLLNLSVCAMFAFKNYKKKTHSIYGRLLLLTLTWFFFLNETIYLCA